MTDLSRETISVLTSIGRARPSPAPQQVDLRTLPLSTLTFAQTGEDMLLRRMFKNMVAAQKMGTYLDVGCAWPVEGSNTYLFYCLGWRGVGVDANAAHAENWRTFRPEDKFIQAAVVEEANDIRLYRNLTNNGAHRVGQSDAKFGDEFNAVGQRVPSLCLDAIFASHFADKPIHIMSMDVEGSELTALKSNDWKRWRPKVICIECWDIDLEDLSKSAEISLLREVGYKVTSALTTNVILKDSTATLTE